MVNPLEDEVRSRRAKNRKRYLEYQEELDALEQGKSEESAGRLREKNVKVQTGNDHSFLPALFARALHPQK